MSEDVASLAKRILDHYSKWGLDKQTTLDKLTKPVVMACVKASDNNKKAFFGCINDSYVHTRRKLKAVYDEFRGKKTTPENLEALKERLNEVCLKKAGVCLGDMNEKLVDACSNLPTMDDVIMCVAEGTSFAQLAGKEFK